MSLLAQFSGSAPVSLEEREVMSIILNLNNILNTRKGYGSFLPDLGIQDMNEYRSHTAISKEVMKQVKRNIELYEPRLENISIKIKKSDDPARLYFDIECTVKNSKRVFLLTFDSFVQKFQIGHPGPGKTP